MEILYFPCCYLSLRPALEEGGRSHGRVCSSRPGSISGSSATEENCCGESIRKTGNEDAVQAPGQGEHQDLHRPRGQEDPRLVAPLLPHLQERVPRVHGELRGRPHLAVPLRTDRRRAARARRGVREDGRRTTTRATSDGTTASTTSRGRSSRRIPGLELVEMADSRQGQPLLRRRGRQDLDGDAEGGAVLRPPPGAGEEAGRRGAGHRPAPTASPTSRTAGWPCEDGDASRSRTSPRSSQEALEGSEKPDRRRDEVERDSSLKRHASPRRELRRRHGGRRRDQRHPGRAGPRHLGVQGLPGREGADHRRQDGPARQDLPHERLLDVHRVAEVHRVRPAPQHRDPHLYRGRQGRRGGRGLHGHAHEEAPVHHRGQVHGLRRPAPSTARSRSPIRSTRSCPTTRPSTSTSRRPCRSSPISTTACRYLAGQEVRDLRGRLQEQARSTSTRRRRSRDQGGRHRPVRRATRRSTPG